MAATNDQMFTSSGASSENNIKRLPAARGAPSGQKSFSRARALDGGLTLGSGLAMI